MLLRNICMVEFPLLFKVQNSIHYVVAAITHTFFHLLENELNLRIVSVIVTPQLWCSASFLYHDLRKSNIIFSPNYACGVPQEDENNIFFEYRKYSDIWVRVMPFKAISNNISVILWPSVLLAEETGVPGKNHWPTWSHVAISPWARVELPALVISTDCTRS